MCDELFDVLGRSLVCLTFLKHEPTDESFQPRSKKGESE